MDFDATKNKPWPEQLFYVVDRDSGEAVRYPTNEEEYKTLTVTRETALSFAIDCDGELIIVDGCGNWVYAPEKYEYRFNKK